MSVFKKVLYVMAVSVGALYSSLAHAEYKEISQIGCEKSVFFQEMKLSEKQKELLVWWHLDQMREDQKKDIEKVKKEVRDQITVRQEMLWHWFCEQPIGAQEESVTKWKSASILFDQLAQQKLEKIKLEITQKDLMEDYQVLYPKKMYVDLVLAVYTKEAIAKKMLKRAIAGESLSLLAKQSDIPLVVKKEGKVGFVLYEDLPKAIQEKVESLQTGMIAPDVIATQEGFAVMQLIEKKMESEKEFEEVVPQLKESRAQMLLEASIKSALKKQSE